MRKRFLFFTTFIFLLITLSASADDWDNFSEVDRMWDGQKSITNKEFEEVMDALQVNQKKKEEKQRKKKLKKIGGGGDSLHKDMRSDIEIKELQGVSKPKEEGTLLNIPVSLIINNKQIEKGYYKILAEKSDDGKFYVKFYQSQFFVAQLEVIETQDDFNEEKLDFAKLLPHNDSFVKLIFGSLQFNAYAYIPYIQ